MHNRMNHDTDKTVTTGDEFLMRFKESADRLHKMEKVIEAARQAEKDFMQVNEGFFKGLVPPHFLPVSKALKELDGE